MVTHALNVKGIIYGTVYVNCSEDEHRPEKLIDDSTIEWRTDEIEWVEVVDGDIIDSWDEADEGS
jgi:hypothetical protein